jgi:hypothetical protein
MFSTPVNTLEERAILMRLLAGVQTPPQLVGLQARPARQIVMVRANHICRRRLPSLLELAAVQGSQPAAGRGWRRGSAWDDTDARSIFDRLHAAAVAGGLSALSADRQPEAVIHDAVEDMPDTANSAADDAAREMPVLV